MAITVRPARMQDIPAMHRIRLAVRENRLSDPSIVNESAYRPFVERGAAWVAERDGSLTGFAAIDVEAGAIWALFVAEEAEGLGIGRALHETMFREAARCGLSELTLSTTPGTRADQFYRLNGWTSVGITSSGECILARSVEVTDR